VIKNSAIELLTTPVCWHDKSSPQLPIDIQIRGKINGCSLINYLSYPFEELLNRVGRRRDSARIIKASSHHAGQQ
jgi:hypothetical protein